MDASFHGKGLRLAAPSIQLVDFSVHMVGSDQSRWGGVILVAEKKVPR